MYEKLEKKKKDRMTSSEMLGQNMVDAGNDFGPGTAYGKNSTIIDRHMNVNLVLSMFCFSL